MGTTCEVVDNLYVVTVEEVQTEVQTAIIRNFHDMLYHTQLSYANQKVTAKIYNYLGEFQADYSGDVVFDYEGQQVTAPAVNGIAEIDFIVEAPGKHIVKTANENLRNGEVEINV